MTPVREALLVMEDGSALRGEALGATGTTHGELVFNTGLTGYQEVLSDPSYRGQIVTMTTSHVGVYGCTDADLESERPQVAGFVVREASRVYSSHRAQRSLDEELQRSGVVGIAEVDTRRIVRLVRAHGALRAAISTEVLDADALLADVRAADDLEGRDLVSGAGTIHRYAATDRSGPTAAPAGRARPWRVVALDYGMKRNQLHLLAGAGCEVTVLPSRATASEILAEEPDGLFLSNGPGDPAAVVGPVETLREVVATGLPTFGICLGHQLLALAAGATTYKLPFGHHGTNQPVRDRARATVEITSQNHGFAVATESLQAGGPLGRVEETHVHLSDGCNEGLELCDLPAFSVQSPPEAAPGPHDSRHLFARFTELIARVQGRPSAGGSRPSAGGHD